MANFTFLKCGSIDLFYLRNADDIFNTTVDEINLERHYNNFLVEDKTLLDALM